MVATRDENRGRGPAACRDVVAVTVRRHGALDDTEVVEVARALFQRGYPPRGPSGMYLCGTRVADGLPVAIPVEWVVGVADGGVRPGERRPAAGARRRDARARSA